MFGIIDVAIINCIEALKIAKMIIRYANDFINCLDNIVMSVRAKYDIAVASFLCSFILVRL